MAKVKVYFIPKSRDRAAAEFCTYDTHNVKELYHLLTQKYGDGTLRGGPKKWFFLRSSMIELEDGEYEFWESLLEYKDFTQASVDDACSAFEQCDYEVSDGHVIAPLPPPPAGTPEWEPVASWDSSTRQVSCGALAEHHKLHLQRMGTNMGEGGYKLLELHNMRDLFTLIEGDLCYKGTIDFAVVPYAVSIEDAVDNIRVGFIHYGHKDLEDISDQLSGIHLTKNARHFQGRFSDCSETSRLRDYHPQVLVTLCAALSESEAPLDFIVTDGVTFDLFRFRENTGVLIYHDLSGTEAYFALTEALNENWMSE